MRCLQTELYKVTLVSVLPLIMCLFMHSFMYQQTTFSRICPPACSTALVGQGLIIAEVTRSHYTRLETPGRGIGPSQRLLPASTQHQRQAPVPPAGFQTTIPSSGRPQTHALDRVATGTGSGYLSLCNKWLRTGQLILLRVLHEVKRCSYAKTTSVRLRLVSATKPLITFSWNAL